MSEANKHTPGKWVVSGNSIVTSNDQFCIAVIEDDGGYEAPEEQRDANARLIAAAPELLAACQRFEAVLEMVRAEKSSLLVCLQDDHEVISAAIKKATQTTGA